jgi:hypothetical protein
MDLQDAECKDVLWIILGLGTNEWPDLVNIAINFLVK